MSTTYIRNKGQVTIPADVRRAARLEEGDPIEVEVVEGGILLRPQKVIDATQAWFWSRAWQERVGRSVEQVEVGESERFETDEEFLAALDE
jgi:AbrB family looped-hinge helix DNA binding protein